MAVTRNARNSRNHPCEHGLCIVRTALGAVLDDIALTNSEQERLANIAENERLLQELGIAGGGSSVLGTVPQKRSTAEATRRQRKRTQAETKPTRVQPQRTSARLQGAKPEEAVSDSYAVGLVAYAGASRGGKGA